MNRALDGEPLETPPEKSARPKTKTGEELKLPPIDNKMTAPPKSSKFPVTTAQQIGWKSTRPDCQLEIYGRYAPKARGHIGILKIFNWPPQVL